MFTPYAPRRLTFLGTRDMRGYRVKTYSIVFGDASLDESRFAAGLQLAAAELPSPPVNTERPGGGFVILHQGRTGDYLILGWWDRENELPLRVFIRDGTTWRTARGSESLCVWDLRVVWHEREAYVATVLSGAESGLEEYLKQTLDGWV